jgi:small subunit ribosomal protein S16
MLKIKLAPRGKKHQISYRIVVAESRSKLNSNLIEDLGFYTPQTKKLEVDQNKIADWQKKGAQITLGVDKLLHPEKYPVKPKIKKEKPQTEAPATAVEVKPEEVKPEEETPKAETEETKPEEETPKTEA